MTNLCDPKFAECRECFFFNRRSTACRSCDAGENFEAHMAELDPDTLTLDDDETDDE